MKINKNGVIIFSPNIYSLYTITVTELLIRNGIEVNAIVVKKMLNPTRIVSELRRDGKRLIKKVINKLILKRGAYNNCNYETIADLMKSESINYKSVKDLNKKYGIPIIYTSDINSRKVEEFIKEKNTHSIVFTGGGLVRDNILHSVNGVINCHIGVLPEYRGMDVVEWPVIKKEFDEVGLTTHLMAKGVDTGDILSVKYVNLTDHDKSIKDLRNRIEPFMCKDIVESTVSFVSDRLKPKPQKVEDGKQYFIMHPRLYKIAEKRLNEAIK